MHKKEMEKRWRDGRGHVRKIWLILRKEMRRKVTDKVHSKPSPTSILFNLTAMYDVSRYGGLAWIHFCCLQYCNNNNKWSLRWEKTDSHKNGNCWLMCGAKEGENMEVKGLVWLKVMKLGACRTTRWVAFFCSSSQVCCLSWLYDLQL